MPAPPTPHVLLALQRGAGNQAVTRMLARAKWKPGEVRKQVKDAKAGGAGTKQAVLLAIYNEMRHSLDPEPPEYKKVDAATKSLIAAGWIDAEDVKAFEQEAEAIISG